MRSPSRTDRKGRPRYQHPAPAHAKSVPRGQTPNNVATAVVIKDEDLFLLSASTGDIPLNNDQGFGLYYHDCRFLRGYEFRIGGTRPNALAVTSEQGSTSEFILTDPELTQLNGAKLAKQSVGITWHRTVEAKSLTVFDVIKLTNYVADSIQLRLSFDFQAGFADVFEIRGLHPKKIGRREKPTWDRGGLRFAYDGADGIYRTLEITIRSASVTTRKSGADLKLSLAPNETKQIHVSLTISESSKKKRPAPKGRLSPNTTQIAGGLRKDSDHWPGSRTQLDSSSPLLNNVFQRSIRDLRVLRTSLQGLEYFSAGLPWYGALFGRDSIISSLQALAFEPRIAEQTLRLLAKYQATQVNEWRDEQPGKILHELRVGELAHLNEIPQTPYFGSVDSTPLFLILVARHANWTGDLSIFQDLKPAVERAFDWMARYGDATGNGYLEYSSRSSKGLGNQGWKDSGDSIVNADGTLAKPPIALVEVQGYVYLAKTSMAELFERAGDNDAAERLRTEARELRIRFERDFWLEDRDIYALALEAGNTPAAVVSSNPGQMLWSGMAQPVRAAKTARHLMSPDMFTGWGIRTLSNRERRYNPVGYHLGTVWPHDNSIIAAGFRTYGLDEAACRVFAAVLEAAMHFEHYRLPEVFAGYSKEEFPIPVRYPVACHPQAWAAGAVPFMIEALLGLVPNAFEKKLHIMRPVLPDLVHHLELKGLRLGQSTVDLRFDRNTDDTIATRIIKVRGEVDVEISNAMPPGLSSQIHGNKEGP
jgi:glycogen debranching enzyme